MFTSNRIKFTLALTLAISLLVVIGITSNISETASANPLKGVLFRRHDKKKANPNASEVNFLRKQTTTQDSPREERKFENQIPEHLPIKVKIRAEKEKAAKDLGNDRWHRDLQIEVKNTGDKPIFYISIIIEFPEMQANGNTLTVGVRYGQHSLFDDSKGRANPEDVPLKPKETVILRLEEGTSRGWEIRIAREQRPEPKKVLLRFEQLNFGDGTGFWSPEGAPWPFPRQPRQPAHILNRLRKESEVKSNHAT